jgi:hypothetical protein
MATTKADAMRLLGETRLVILVILAILKVRSGMLRLFKRPLDAMIF